jgi:hypothetical protein
MNSSFGKSMLWYKSTRKGLKEPGKAGKPTRSRSKYNHIGRTAITPFKEHVLYRIIVVVEVLMGGGLQ